MATGITKTYLYKVYRAGAFLGVLPQPSSEFSYPQEINTTFVQIQIEIPLTIDRSANSATLVEQQNDSINLLDESNLPLYEERTPDLVGDENPNALIQEDNVIQIYEISNEDPNGVLVFEGWITDWEADFGESENVVVTCLSKAVDMEDYIVGGSPYVADVSQTAQNQVTGIRVYYSDKGGDFVNVGQTFTTGGAVTNLAAVDLYLQAGDYTIALWPSVATANAHPNDPNGSGNLGTFSFTITTAGINRVTFPTPITVSSATSYFLALYGNLSGGKVGYKDSNVYGGGNMWYVQYGGAGGSVLWESTTYPSSDLYLVTYSNAGATSAAFTTQDPTAILRSIIDVYSSAGGEIDYASGTTDLTGLSVTYTFIAATVLEGLQKCLELAPSDWYYYIDPGSSILYFKQTPTTATHTFIKGRHIDGLKLKRTSDNIKNKLLFTGGDTGGGTNLFTDYTNASSDSSRQRLERITDNRVTLQATADLLADNFLDAHANFEYMATLIILYDNYDISSINAGDTVAFTGFNNFIDRLLLQIVRKVPYADRVELSIGVLPQRLSTKITQAVKDISDLQTVDNPTAPS